MSFGVVRNQSLWKHEAKPLSVERHERKKQRQEALEAAYAAVDKRDGLRCRATGTHLVRGATDARIRLEHHHLVPRSRSRAGRDNPNNIICLSGMAHDLVTRGWIVVEGTDAERPLMFHWTEIATSKPVQIKRHNPSIRDSR